MEERDIIAKFWGNVGNLKKKIDANTYYQRNNNYFKCNPKFLRFKYSCDSNLVGRGLVGTTTFRKIENFEEIRRMGGGT